MTLGERVLMGVREGFSLGLGDVEPFWCCSSVCFETSEITLTSAPLLLWSLLCFPIVFFDSVSGKKKFFFSFKRPEKYHLYIPSGTMFAASASSSAARTTPVDCFIASKSDLVACTSLYTLSATSSRRVSFGSKVSVRGVEAALLWPSCLARRRAPWTTSLMLSLSLFYFIVLIIRDARNLPQRNARLVNHIRDRLLSRRL